jgi:hypothetical protein
LINAELGPSCSRRRWTGRDASSLRVFGALLRSRLRLRLSPRDQQGRARAAAKRPFPLPSLAAHVLRLVGALLDDVLRLARCLVHRAFALELFGVPVSSLAACLIRPLRLVDLFSLPSHAGATAGAILLPGRVAARLRVRGDSAFYWPPRGSGRPSAVSRHGPRLTRKRPASTREVGVGERHKMALCSGRLHRCRCRRSGRDHHRPNRAGLHRPSRASPTTPLGGRRTRCRVVC